MTKIFDLKSSGISQDVKELKEKKEKSSGMRSAEARARLAYAKEKAKPYNPYTEERGQKREKLNALKRKVESEKQISQIKKLKEETAYGRLKKRLGEKLEKFGNQRVISRQVLKKEPRATIVIKSTPVSSTFFNKTYEWEKKNILKW